MDRVTASALDLMNQAPMTVSVYLDEAIKTIDRTFNTTGYAKAHPELVGAFIQACALDLQGSVILAGLQDLERAVESCAPLD